jgi:tRNA(fMet)-specific endonuclease VapC
MDPTSLGVILDSSLVIEAERQRLNAVQFLRNIEQKIGETEVALCAITVAELALGIYRADTFERRQRRRAFLDELKAVIPVYPITDSTAELVGKVGAESSTVGIAIPFDDLLIGVCALERGYAVATRNVRHFQKITGLTERDPNLAVVARRRAHRGDASVGGWLPNSCAALRRTSRWRCAHSGSCGRSWPSFRYFRQRQGRGTR